MQIIRYPGKTVWEEILKRPSLPGNELDAIVAGVLEKVRLEGDKALLAFTETFDKVHLDSVKVNEQEFAEAEKKVDERLKIAIAKAAKNIEKFHRSQQLQPAKVETSPGVICWQKPVAIEKVGLYIPGGSAPLFSTVLMLAIPAAIAGCRQVILCTPPDRDGKVHPAVLYAARITGVTGVYKAGGAQAIAAMAYGTELVPQVNKIFGPGNQYVTAAKRLVAGGETAIDMPAGPSEVAVVADQYSNAAFVASDLLSQAEHGPDSQVLLFTTDDHFAGNVEKEVLKQLDVLPRKEIASKSLNHSRIIVLKTMDEVMQMVNQYAPEHLILSVQDAEKLAEQVIHAGSVFLGPYTPESAGDYASGTNHTLPTNGYARTYSGVNLDHFVRKITFQQITREGLEDLAPVIIEMAEAESLVAHSRAVKIRLS
jgi:histidinol dehydrogenase